MSPWLVIVTKLEGPGDFEVVGAFENRDDAVAWSQAAFFDERWKDCLFRVKEMRSRDSPPSREPHPDPIDLDQ